MKLLISVADGFHGRPAAGIGVSIASGGDRRTGFTDESGEFGYEIPGHASVSGGNFHIEIDVDAYFSALGIVSFYKRVCAWCRLHDQPGDHRVIAVITPSMQTLSAA